MRILKIGLALACSGAITLAHAAPAAPGVMQIKNRDGISFAARLKGDEHFHWVETADGSVVIKNVKTGDFEYARISEGALVPSGVKPGVAASTAKSGATGTPLKAADPAFRELIKSKHQHNSKPRTARTANPNTASTVTTSTAASASTTTVAAGAVTAPPPGQGHDHGPASKWNFIKTPPTIPLLTLMVEFNDQQFRNPVSAWVPKIYGMAPGQMGHYWKTVSNGRFHFAAAPENQGTVNDGVVRVRLPINHPNRNGDGTDLLQALAKLDPFVDFSRFDTNRDGFLTLYELQILVIYSGGELSSGSTLPGVWGAAVPEPGVVLDGVELELEYPLVGERHAPPPDERDATIGILAHELGHSAFGLPDLYDIDSSSMGVGIYCLMGYGSWGTGPGELMGASPIAPSAWIRYRLGFNDLETVVPGTPLSQTLKPQSRQGLLTLIPTDVKQQYFLVENRYHEGTDIGLGENGPSGAMIWYIDEFQSKNHDDDFRLVDYRRDDVIGQVFWPEQGRTQFSGTTVPNSRANGGTPTGVTITGFTRLADADHSIRFVAEKRTAKIYPTMHVRGTSNNWAATPMELVEPGVWEVTQTFLPGTVNPRFKLDVAGDWVTSFGDTNKDWTLEQGGGDIPAPTGTHRIRVWESKMNYTFFPANQPPVANAGPDRVVFVDQPVTLDGSASYDTDGTVTWYRWSTGHDTAQITLSFPTPGTRIVTLRAIDNDGGDASDDVIIEVKARGDNLAPTARIAPITGATVGTPVVFDGSTSSDTDGTIASYAWTINGIAGTLSDVKPSYTFTAAGAYTVSLVVTDNAGAQSIAASTTVNVAPSSFKKTYNQVYYRGTSNNWAADTKLSLTGDNLWSTTVVVPSTGTQTFKFDINGDWTLNFGDNNADGLAEQSGGNIVFPAGGGTFAITFNDATRRYTVIKQSTGNQAPTATVVADQTVIGAATVNLDGSASKDSDGTIAFYQWTQIAGPTLSITNPTQALAKVSLPAVTSTTTYRFRLTVTDNAGASASAETLVTQQPTTSCTAPYTQMNLRGTHNSWGVTAMTRAADCYWEATATFGSTTTERFKFDVSGNWATNFGDSNKDGIAEAGGADIAISGGAGSYRIRFDDVSKRYTVVKQ